MVTKAISMGIAFLFIVSGLMIFTNPVSETQATSSGDVYSGSGDWTITNPTTYTGETFTVYGNVTISGAGSLLLNGGSMLTIDQPSPMEHSITVGTSCLMGVDASWIGSTNKTPGQYNTMLKVAGGHLGAMYATFDGILFFIGSDALGSAITHSFFYSCQVWGNSGLGYETGEPIPTTQFALVDVLWKNTDTTGMTYLSVIETGNNMIVEDCVFMNITLPSGASDYCSIIRSFAQDHIRIHGNTFPDSGWSPIFMQSATGYTMHDITIEENTWLGVGSDYAHLGYGMYLKDGAGPLSNCVVRDNTFDIVRNGSKGILITESDWQVNDNTFNYIDASGLTTAGSTNGIRIEPPGESIFDGNIINRMVGPGADTGAGCIGIISQSAGGFTISHSIIRNLSYLSCAISVVDPLVFAGLPDILVHANTISNMHNASGGIAIFGGHDAVVSWNNMSDIDGSSVGVMFDGTAHHGLVHNNSVIGLHGAQGGFVWPAGWQIVVGAYTYYAGGSTEGPTFKDNHAAGELTAAHPAYNITGEKLGGGWWPNARMLVDTSEESIIHYQNANVTLRHDSQMLGVLKDGATQTMRFYNNGTSWAWFNKTDLDHHFVNTTPSNVYLAVNPAGQAINASYLGVFDGVITFRLNGSGSAIANITVTGLEPGNRYYVSIDGAPVLRLMASGSGTIIFDYSGPWSEHEFEVTPGIYGRTIVQLGAIIGIMMMLGILVSVIVPVVQVAQEKRKFKVDDIINMVIYIVVSVGLIGLVYALLP